MTEASRPKHIFIAKPVVRAIRRQKIKSSRPTQEPMRVKRRWSKILAGACEKGHPLKAFAIKQVKVGWCELCGQEKPIK